MGLSLLKLELRQDLRSPAREGKWKEGEKSTMKRHYDSKQWVSAGLTNFIVSVSSGYFKDWEQVIYQRTSHTLSGNVTKSVTICTPSPLPLSVIVCLNSQPYSLAGKYPVMWREGLSNLRLSIPSTHYSANLTSGKSFLCHGSSSAFMLFQNFLLQGKYPLFTDASHRTNNLERITSFTIIQSSHSCHCNLHANLLSWDPKRVIDLSKEGQVTLTIIIVIAIMASGIVPDTRVDA